MFHVKQIPFMNLNQTHQHERKKTKMKNLNIYAFADEASPMIDAQIQAMQRNHLQGLEIRDVDGENVSAISLASSILSGFITFTSIGAYPFFFDADLCCLWLILNADQYGITILNNCPA